MSTNLDSIPETSSTQEKKFSDQAVKSKFKNSKDKRFDKRRQQIGPKVQQQRKENQYALNLDTIKDVVMTLPQSYKLSQPEIRTYMAPVTLTIFGILVEAFFYRYRESINQQVCTIYQLFRVTLAQFELHWYNMPVNNVSNYPVNRNLVHDFPANFRQKIKANPYNAKALVLAIETFGEAKHGEITVVPYIPSTLPEDSHLAVHFTNLNTFVRSWALQGDPLNNPLPGAIYRGNQLANPDDFWPQGYNENDLMNDCDCVVQMLELLRTKFSGIIAQCSFSGNGRAAQLVATYDKIIVPYDEVYWVSSPIPESSSQPPAKSARKGKSAINLSKGKSPAKRMAFKRIRDPTPPESSIPSDIPSDGRPEFVPDVKIRNPITSEDKYWSPFKLTDLEYHLGIFTRYGYIDPEEMMQQPRYATRIEYNNVESMSGDWQNVWNTLTPVVTRTI